MSAGALLLAAVLSLAPPAWSQQRAEAVATFGDERAVHRLVMQAATDLVFMAPLLQAFVTEWPEIHVTFEAWNSNELYQAAAAACRGETPPVDLVMSSAVDQQVKLVNDGCAQPYRSLATTALPAATNWRDEVFGVTQEPVVIVYNRALMPGEAPVSRFDLLDLLRREGPRFADRVATYDIEQSGVGYLFAFLDSQQATTFGALIEAFGRIDAVATCCSAEIIDGVASGRYLVAYNMLGSYALARAAEDPNLGVVAPEDYTLVLSRALLIPRNAPNAWAAGRFIDFILSPGGQRAMAATNLTVDLDSLGTAEAAETMLHAIPLSPVLLVGLDQQKRAQLLTLWRATFPPPAP